ncbi:MAG: DUF1329 domain-containing protein [Candidatus Binataceae bacterium]
MRVALGSFLVAALLCAVSVSYAAEGTIPPGTVITTQNWQKYKEFMPEGMQILFEGTYHWKFPANFQMKVGPTQDYRPPKIYAQNTEKYSKLVKIVNLPDGGHTVTGYVAGMPFPDPQAPLKGYKILVNVWYSYFPYLYCGWASLYVEDRMSDISPTKAVQVYRRLLHISDLGQPINDPRAEGIDYSEYLMVTQPEQARYTTNLALYYDDPAKPFDIFLYVPALRRSLRLSPAARCSPVVGTDFTQDDARINNYNGGITRFDAKFLGERKILALLPTKPKIFTDLHSMYMPLFFPGPKFDPWQVRDVNVIDVRRIPSQRAGYCYGKRIMYVDKANMISVWTDLYDANLKLWKFILEAPVTVPLPDGEVAMGAGNILAVMYDIQNSHLSVYVPGSDGAGFGFNETCKNYKGQNFDDVKRYSYSSGLALIQR